MKPALSVLMLAGSISIVGCEDLSAPTEGLEPISAVVVEHRTLGSDEPVPDVRISGGVHAISFQVTTRAACATIVLASYRLQPRHIDIVAQVSGDPRALCAPIPESLVADYSAEIPGLEPGYYSVSIFESRGGGEARFIGSGAGTSFAKGS